MSNDPHTDLLNRTDSTLGYLIESGQTDVPQYGLLAQARSGLVSEPVGTPRYDAQARVAEAQMAQVAEQRAADARQGLTSDSEYAAACPDCQPGQPCCLRGFEVSDAGKSSRKVVWPIQAGAPDTLFMIAKDPFRGRPSAKVKTKLTDFQVCQMGEFEKPALPLSRFSTSEVAHAGRVETENTVTIPFNPATVTDGIFPKEILISMYICGYYVLANAYKPDSSLPRVNPGMTMMPESGGPKIKAVPHVSLDMEVAGEVYAEFFMGRAATLGYTLTGSVNGEVANTSLSYSAGTAASIGAPPDGQGNGPVNNSMMSSISKIYEKVGWMADNSSATGGAPVAAGLSGVQVRRSSIRVSLGATLTVGSLKLEGKDASPDLELAIDPITFRITLGIRGKMDIIDLMISRVPLLAERLREARSSLEGGSIAQVKLTCDIILSAEGGVEFSAQAAAPIAITSADGWEEAFRNITTVYQADAKITGRVVIEAKVGIDTWLFDGSIEASLSGGTGWHFGGRTTQNPDGTQKTETLYWFEGLRVQGSYAVRLGAMDRDRDTDSFETGSDETIGTRTTTVTTDNRTTLSSGDFDVSFFVPEGGEDNWQET